tara:strand:+ start:3589 stop:4851 length:1263 start_codon:yes stop_codon:yes gene_type:complete
MPEFDPDDIIKLALANESYGFDRFLQELYGRNTTRHSEIIRLFSIHKKETGVDPFEVLQSTNNIRMVTGKEYRKITGKSRVPKGTGRATGGRPSKASPNYGRGHKVEGDNQADVPLVPEVFEWLDVVPIEEGQNPYAMNAHNLAGFHMDLFDFARFFDLYENKVMTVKQVSEKMKIREKKLHNFISKLSLYEDDGVAEQWSGVLKRLWDIQTHRGKTHTDDELMMELRGIFRDYVNDPVNVEAPTISDIDWVYGKLLEEEGTVEDWTPANRSRYKSKDRIMIEASLIKKFNLSTFPPINLYSKIPDNLRASKIFSNKDMEVKAQVMHIISQEGSKDHTRAINILFAIEGELYRLSQLGLEELEFRTLHDEIKKIEYEFNSEPWFDFDGDWRNRDCLLTIMVNYALELNNLQTLISEYLNK